MRKTLQRQRDLQQVEINEIITIAQQKEYQKACRKHFEYSHKNASVEQVGNHPNAWFEESVKYYEKQRGNAPSTNESDKKENPNTSSSSPSSSDNEKDNIKPNDSQ